LTPQKLEIFSKWGFGQLLGLGLGGCPGAGSRLHKAVDIKMTSVFNEKKRNK
jgi:hypothetical protein